MKIQKDSVVTINYKLTQNDASGEIIQEVKDEEPFAFLFGHGQVLPQFETNLSGKEKGASFEFGIKSDDGYGAHDPNAVTELPINIFMKDGELLEYVKVGNFLPMNDNEGNQLQGLVLEVNDDTIKMDFNHPMAGVDLYFAGEVLDVRSASPEEIDHGHVHGPGGHHH